MKARFSYGLAAGLGLLVLSSHAAVAQQRSLNQGEIDALMNHLRNQEQRIQQLESQVRGPSGPIRHLPAVIESGDRVEQRLANLESSYRYLADEKAASKEDVGPKRIDIQTKPSHKWRGRIYFDQIMYDDPGPIGVGGIRDRMNSTGFDTARIGVTGNVYENLKYTAEFEFEGEETDFKDVYMEYGNLPVLGHIKAGFFKAPMSLEDLTSSRYVSFMERSAPTTAFAPGRLFGVSVHDYFRDNENASWWLGTFRADSLDNFLNFASLRQDEGDWGVYTRGAMCPIYDEPSGGRYLVHLGGSYAYQRSADDVVFEPAAELGGQNGDYISSVTGTSRDWNTFGGEFGLVWGPASLSSDFYYVETEGGEEFNGGRITMSYFLTGEHRGYNRAYKVFSRVKPISPFFKVRTADGVCRGPGAWELAMRYSWIDLRDPGATGNTGYRNGYTFGVNWYLNPYSRVMFNWLYEDYVDLAALTGGDTNGNTTGIRWQVDW